MTPKRVRIAVLWTHLSGYMNACLRALAVAPDTDVFVSYSLPASDAPFDQDAFSWIPSRLTYLDQPDGAELLHRLEGFEPTAIVVGAWGSKQYKAALRRWSTASRIVVMDNQWRGTIRQRAAVAMRRMVIRPYYDWAFVAGERQAQFARRLGFRADRVLTGGLACDFDAFASAGTPEAAAAARFVYVGRASPEKGIDVLIAAYARYRDRSASPWPLDLVGAGHRPDGLGVRAVGFIQPQGLPAELARGGTFVLPSRSEPWGVVLQEAAAIGLPLIATDVCGATPHMLRNGVNGITVGAGRADELADALLEIERLHPAARAQMGVESRRLAGAFTPSTWSSAIRWMESRKHLL